VNLTEEVKCFIGLSGVWCAELPRMQSLSWLWLGFRVRVKQPCWCRTPAPKLTV